MASFDTEAQAAQLLLSCSSTAFAASGSPRYAATASPRVIEGSMPHNALSQCGDVMELPASSGSGRRPLSIVSALDTAEADTSPTAAASAGPSPRWLKKSTNQQANSRRSSKPMPSLSNLHPVLKLGYSSMCEVHCNGLQGNFLGGHDRDLFIQCTNPEYRSLPLVDVNQGGCIMSCSNFEKVAGRELSKKWKESIHVVGEGEGSKATLLAWLKRQAERMSSDIVGRSVWVCWCNEAEYYLGHIVSFNKENGKHKVKYNERYVEELHLPVEKIDFGSAKPEPFANTVAAGAWPPVARPVLQPEAQAAFNEETFQGFAASPQLAEPVEYVSQQMLQQHLVHQSSGTSMTSSSTEQRTGFRNLGSRKQHSTAPVSPRLSMEGPRTTFSSGRARRRGSDCTDAVLDEGDVPRSPARAGNRRSSTEFGEAAMPAVPKRLRTGLKEPASLRHTFSTPNSSRDQDLHLVDCHSPHTPASSSAFTTSMAPTARLLPTAGLAHATSFAPASTLAATSSLAIANSQCDQPGSRGYPPAMLGSISSVQQMSILATPPSLGLQETDVVVMSCWMNKVALQLDDVLVDGVHVLAEPVEAPLAGSRQHQLGSPSARFQNLLIHARGRGTVPGFYEAMLTRYDHFKDKPATLLLKMAQFITVVLNTDSA